MSYSFGARGICKADALLELDAKVDKLIMPDVCRDMIFRHARGVVAALDDPNYGEELVIICHGFSAESSERRTTSVQCSISAFVMVKP